ncbi:hypothetical protein PROFUN_01529 [Planoprotostelium fungivorum]|uniref:CCR4-NOT transcription complex subunit 3 n=1 Tax=Planoprotostelium fungivorum TaxID=1890364 RepID=A0A2P6NTG7_9EUKA|nr:hypothetical protein PROFUN_01529 [Planoprotostelium fungivorum]
MSVNRKLQGEIDRLLKKVVEGVEEFDNILEKVHAATSSNQKEKYEADLKKEIKKLQRSRDQIKTWIASNEVKQKNPLLEARKNIESKMEQFKACERDSKMKAYSKEGLSQQTTDDDGKNTQRQWIGKCLRELREQIDQYETEMETITPSIQKGKKTTSNPRLEELTSRLERHNFHIEKLERVLRNLENDTITIEQVDDITESVDYYIDSHSEPDFVDDDEIYDSLGLKEDDDNLMLRNSAGDMDTDDDSSDDSTPPPSGRSGLTSSTPTPTHTPAPPSLNKSTGVIINANKPKESAPPVKAAVPPSPQKVTPAPVAQYSILSNNLKAQQQAAAAAQAQKVTQQQPAPQPKVKAAAPPPAAPAPTAAPTPTPVTQPVTIARPRNTSTPSAPGTTSVPGHTPIVSFPARRGRSAQYSQFVRNAPGNGASPTTAPTSTTPPPGIAPVSAPIAAPVAAPTTTSQSQNSALPSYTAQSAAGNVTVPPSGGLMNPVIGPQQSTEDSRDYERNKFFSGDRDEPLDDKNDVNFDDRDGLNDFATSHGKFSAHEQDSIMSMLEGSLKSLPEPNDSERHRPKPKPYLTPSYYPQVAAGIFENPQLFEKFDTDTLFFIFYFQQGTYQQYLAAKELKKQSWRYHKKYLTWFQRHEEPKEISNDSEQGTYVYFDYETGWCQRKKTEFTFEYRFLEDYD